MDEQGLSVAVIWSRLNAARRIIISLVVVCFLAALLTLGANMLPGQTIPSQPGGERSGLAATAAFTDSPATEPVQTGTPPAPKPEPAQDTGRPDPFHPANSTWPNMMENVLLSRLALNLSAPLPDHPRQVTLYRRLPETLTLEGASAIARQFGIDTPLQSRQGEAGNNFYTASKDAYTINIYSDSPPFFALGRDPASLDATPKQYTFAELAQMAEALFDEHGLPGFPYRLEPVYLPDETGRRITVAQVIDGLPLYQNSLRSPWTWLIFNAEGQLENLLVQKLDLAPDGTAAIRPVEEVWADLQAHRLQGKSALHILTGTDYKGDPAAETASIDKVELVYYAQETGGMWFGQIPADHAMRLVQPVWRFAGKLSDGTPVEILAEPAAIEQPAAAAATQESAPPAAGKINPNAGESTVNVRAGPSPRYDIIGTVETGQAVGVTGRSPQGEWWRIKVDGVEGWIFHAFVSVDHPLAVPCVEITGGDCSVPTPPDENEQAVASIRAMRGNPALVLSFCEETHNPNADVRKTLVYVDDQGGEYWVDQETMRVVQWMPPNPGEPGEAKSIDELRSIASSFALTQSPRFYQDKLSLTYSEMTKDGSHYAFRWEDPNTAAQFMVPFLQVVVRTDGYIVQYMNTLDIFSP